MHHPLEAALANPWNLLELVLDGPLHPGGVAATDALLDRAEVDRGTRVFEVGCGAGGALARARERGAAAIGLDRAAAGSGMVRGDLAHLPVRNGSVDVVLAECVLCLADDYRGAVEEVHRVLRRDGRLAMSDVVLEEGFPEVPAPLAELFCLDGPRGHAAVRRELEAAGFTVSDVRTHREDLLELRDRAASRVDYEGMLALMGPQGAELLEGIKALEAAIDSGELDYVSLIARP